jgi:hypothetical protein
MTTTEYLRGRGLRRTWFRWVTAGECAGFAVPAIAGAMNATAALLVVAGVVEGAVLGWVQARVLRRAVPGFPVRQWIAATAVAAGFTWAVAMTAVANGERLASWPAAVLVPVATLAGAAGLLSIGVAQWLVLHDHVANAHWWIWTTALAWAAALVVFMTVATPLWQPGQALLLTVLIGVLAGLLMAATMATITGATLDRLLR